MYSAARLAVMDCSSAVFFDGGRIEIPSAMLLQCLRIPFILGIVIYEKFKAMLPRSMRGIV